MIESNPTSNVKTVTWCLPIASGEKNEWGPGGGGREGWRSPVRSYNSVKVKITMEWRGEFHHFLEPTVNSIYDGARKLGINQPRRLWLLPPKAPTNLGWWRINLLAFLFPLFSLSVSPREIWNITFHWEKHSKLTLAAPGTLLMNIAQCRFLRSLHQQLIDLLKSK